MILLFFICVWIGILLLLLLLFIIGRAAGEDSLISDVQSRELADEVQKKYSKFQWIKKIELSITLKRLFLTGNPMRELQGVSVTCHTGSHNLIVPIALNAYCCSSINVSQCTVSLYCNVSALMVLLWNKICLVLLGSSAPEWPDTSKHTPS